MNSRRPRSEACRKLTLRHVRPRVAPGDERVILKDQTVISLRWSEIRGCFGDKPGQALMMLCPVCARSCRVLWKPPSRSWGCCRCRPVSHPSHRRSGARRGRPKPYTWTLAQLHVRQRKCAELMGLAEWPPNALLWSAEDLLLSPRRPGAPRITLKRAVALARHIDALDALRLCASAPAMNRAMKSIGHREALADCEARHLLGQAVQVITDTNWALRRGSSDARRRRGSGS